ncbi:hypothetical protein HO173_012869 [Letharia columbiana]|uniref:AA1-like domain-containing protein n=1 Tax=Letharia columbiana TaxID=112416 RepID=A0A8H6CJS0_9LECA|nr:uncharacterized protein HO173_012869 [Letharia columbiana]KAF6224712.1 hypothetical protein HO173_012869 [Letharia columbiana]
MRLISPSLLASLALAAPYVSGQACSKHQSWNISELAIFTAAPGGESSDLIDFAVVDPLVDYHVNPSESWNYFCQRQLPAGNAGSLADPVDYYTCIGSPTQFKWDGVRLSLKEVVECGGNNVTATGTSKPVFATDCYATDANGADGEWCLATYDFNITITFT